MGAKGKNLPIAAARWASNVSAKPPIRPVAAISWKAGLYFSEVLQLLTGKHDSK